MEIKDKSEAILEVFIITLRWVVIGDSGLLAILAPFLIIVYKYGSDVTVMD